jgi:hypothetical protein
MKIADIVKARGILEILHFTTNSGLAGVFATGAIRPRARLTTDAYVEHIYRSNCPDRSRDAEWHDYVNLSVTQINTRLFGISDGKWHWDLDGWWCILSLDPEILTHQGVYFATTNNMYSGVRRLAGADGLEALFAPEILQYVRGGRRVMSTRVASASACEPTCSQAEVLYPGDLSIEYLRLVYVRDPEHADAAHGIISAVGGPPVEIVVDASRFA